MVDPDFDPDEEARRERSRHAAGIFGGL